MIEPRTRVTAVLAGAGLLAASSLATAAPVPIEKRTRIAIEVRPLTAELVSEQEALHTHLVIDSYDPAETTIRLAWPGASDRSTLALRATRVAPPAGSAYAVEIDGRLTLPDGSIVHAARSVAFDEETTALFEVYRYGDRSLTVAIQTTVSTEMVVAAKRAPGSQVRFRLEIVRVLDGREASLEDNYLNTLVGEPVSYAFRMSDTPEAESVTITLRPLRLHSNIGEIDVEIAGKLTLEDELVVIGRTEHWLASRGATSTLAFEAGEPPSGYRFRITARF